MIAFPRTRTIATILLASALALPAYTCDGYRSPQGELVESIPADADSAGYTPARIPHRPIGEFDATELSEWLTLLAYTWPILILGMRLRGRPARLERAMHWAELICAPAAAVMIYYVAATGKIAYGTYLAWAANATLFAAAIAEFLRRRRAAGGS
jgi:hypothetical protein